MAITLLGQQATPLESFTNAVWTVSSNNPNIKKMVGVFQGVNGNSVASDITLQVQPSIAGTAVFEFDLQEFYRDNVSYDIQTPAIAARQYTAPNSYFRLLSYEFTELLNSNGVLVTGGDLLAIVDKTVINAARQTYNAAGLPNKVITAGVGFGEFLTNSPRTINIATGESYVLSLYSSNSSPNAIAVSFLNEAGSTISVQYIDYTASISGRYDVAVGLANLATAGITPPAGSAYYVVAVGVKTGTPPNINFALSSEVVFFRIVTQCEGAVRVHFLNRWGGYDSYTFTGFNTSSVKPSSTQYEKYLRNGFTPKDRGAQAQYRDVVQTMTLNSDILSQDESEWLAELVGSPVAYMETAGQLIPITIDDERFVYDNQNKLGSLTLAIRLANNIRNQRL
jgi:hypothetical protein